MTLARITNSNPNFKGQLDEHTPYKLHPVVQQLYCLILSFIANLRIAWDFCRRCVSVIDGEVKASCSAASGDEAVAVADLRLWGSAVT